MNTTTTDNGPAGERTLASIAEAMRASEGASGASASNGEQVKPRGFADLQCPKCGEPGDLVLRLSEAPILHCVSCNEDMTAAEMRRLVGRWSRVLAWIETAPIAPLTSPHATK